MVQSGDADAWLMLVMCSSGLLWILWISVEATFLILNVLLFQNKRVEEKVK